MSGCPIVLDVFSLVLLFELRSARGEINVVNNYLKPGIHLKKQVLRLAQRIVIYQHGGTILRDTVKLAAQCIQLRIKARMALRILSLNIITTVRKSFLLSSLGVHLEKKTFHHVP